jgi:ABC-type transport system involved in multi-copper enzyme maturation permease subunit
MIFGSSALVFGLLVTWITPLWLLSVGVALGFAVLGILYGVVFLFSRRLAEVVYTSVREGVLLPIFYLGACLSVFALLGVFLVPGLPYRPLMGAVARLTRVGRGEIEVVVPPSTHDQELPLQVRLAELTSFTLESDQPLGVSTNIASGLAQTLSIRLPAGAVFTWDKNVALDRDKGRDKPPSAELSKWTATNVTTSPAKLRINTVTDIEYPEVRVVPATALALAALLAVYLALQLALPKVAAIAMTTAKEATSQPLFYVTLVMGSFLLLAFVFIPYYTFGDDVKMLKDSGLTLIMVLAMIVAVWSASVSVSEEVEGRTALTVLSKPVQRRQFILGKFLGILCPVVVLFVVLGLLFLITVCFKVVYDSREVAKAEPSWQACYLEMIRTLPGLVLAFMETVVLSAISVAISTRLPMLANLIVCASIYVLGHLVPMLVNSSVGKFEIVRFIGQFIATVLPVMDHFNIQAAVAAGASVPASYLGMALVYCLLYSSIALLLGLAMFEDRDLA